MNHSMNKFCLTVFIALAFSVSCKAQEYIMQERDVISVTFWQESSLNTQSKIGADGAIELPVIGKIRAAGLTTGQLADNIVDRISRYRISITQASVAVIEYSGNKIFITGQVGAPGTYSFESIPDMWRVLQEAGGLLETADPEKITIIRDGDGRGNVTEVDLSRYFEGGDILQLPKLTGGETIHVPSRSTTGSDQSTGASPFSSRDEIYIMGEVASPGRYSLEKGVDVLDALILAGGPTELAKLSDVRIMKRWQGKNGMMKIDLNEFLEHSEPGPPQLNPGDTIYVPRKLTSGIGGFILNNLLLPISSSLLLFFILGRR